MSAIGRLRSVVALEYHDVGIRHGKSQFFRILVARRAVTRDRGRIARKLEKNSARAKPAFDLLRLPAACEEPATKFAKRSSECLSVLLIGAHIPHIDRSNPIALCHFNLSPLELSRRRSLSQQLSGRSRR